MTLEGPSSAFLSDMITNQKGAAGDIRYRLLWESAAAENNGNYIGTSPPAGLLPSGEGADPGLFDVDPKTGETTAIPRSNGEFAVYLIVDDAAGSAAAFGLPNRLDQAVVKTWTFTVTGKPDFVVDSYRRTTEGLDDVNIGDAPYIIKTAVGSIKCVVGRTYHVAPIAYSSLLYQHASGGDGANIKFTVRNPPPGFFIDPETGEIQGTPKPVGDDGVTQYTATLLAIDPAGAQAVLEEIEITILPRPQFVPVFQKVRRVLANENDRYTDPSDQAQTDTPFRVGSSYRIATLQLDNDATQLSAGSIEDITYTLSADAIDSFFVQAKSGDIFGTFPRPGTYSFNVLAIDQAGSTAVVEALTFRVMEPATFKLAVTTKRARSGVEFTDSNLSSYIVDETYRFSPLQLSEGNTEVSAGVFANITYTLEAPDGWFVSAQTGEIFGKFDKTGIHDITLFGKAA